MEYKTTNYPFPALFRFPKRSFPLFPHPLFLSVSYLAGKPLPPDGKPIQFPAALFRASRGSRLSRSDWRVFIFHSLPWWVVEALGSLFWPGFSLELFFLRECGESGCHWRLDFNLYSQGSWSRVCLRDLDLVLWLFLRFFFQVCEDGDLQGATP